MQCEDCGVGSTGAFLVDVDDRVLCVDCAAPQDCERCGQPTDRTTLSGTFRCADCQDLDRSRGSSSRELGQSGLDTFGGND